MYSRPSLVKMHSFRQVHGEGEAAWETFDPVPAQRPQLQLLWRESHHGPDTKRSETPSHGLRNVADTSDKPEDVAAPEPKTFSGMPTTLPPTRLPQLNQCPGIHQIMGVAAHQLIPVHNNRHNQRNQCSWQGLPSTQ